MGEDKSPEAEIVTPGNKTVSSAEKSVKFLKQAGVLTPEGTLSPATKQTLKQLAAAEKTKADEIVKSIQASGKEANMMVSSVEYNNADIDAFMLQKERSNLALFSEQERAQFGIVLENAKKPLIDLITGTPKLDSMTGEEMKIPLTKAEQTQLAKLINARHDLQYVIANWTTAYYDYDNNHDRTKKEYVTAMQGYQVIGDAFGDPHPSMQPKLKLGKWEFGGQRLKLKSESRQLIESYPGVLEAMRFIRTSSVKGSWLSPQVMDTDRGVDVCVEYLTTPPAARGLGLDALTAITATGLAKKLMIATGEHEKLGAKKLPRVLEYKGAARQEAAVDTGKSLLDLFQTLLK